MPENKPDNQPDRGKPVVDKTLFDALFFSKPEVRQTRSLSEIFEAMYEKPVFPQDTIGIVRDELEKVTEGVLNPLIDTVAEFSGRSLQEVSQDFFIQYAEGVDVDLAVFIPFALKEDKGVRVIPPFPSAAKDTLATIFPFFNLNKAEPEVLEKGVFSNGEVGVFLVLEEGREYFYPTLYANFDGVKLLLRNFERSLKEETSSMSVIKNVIMKMRSLEIRKTIACCFPDLTPNERREVVQEVFEKLKGYAQTIERLSNSRIPLWKQINGEFVVTVGVPDLPDSELFRNPNLILPLHLAEEVRYVPKTYKIKLLGDDSGSGEVRVEPSDAHLIIAWA